MKNKKTRTGLWLLILLLLLAASLMGAALGKYSKKFQVYENSVQFTAELAESMAIVESNPEKQASGEYTLASTKVTNASLTYTLIPGLDIPKDPRIVITGKTQIPAYLYLTVTDTSHSAITYNLATCWENVQDNTYVYTGTGTEPVQITGDIEVPILADNRIYVSQTLLSSGEAGGISFSAKLTEKAEH